MEPVLIHKDTSVIRSPTDAPLREPSPSKRISLTPFISYISAFSTADDFLNQALEALSLSTPSEAEEQNESSKPYGNGTPSKSPVNSCLKAVYGITRKTKPGMFVACPPLSQFSQLHLQQGRHCYRPPLSPPIPFPNRRVHPHPHPLPAFPYQVLPGMWAQHRLLGSPSRLC